MSLDHRPVDESGEVVQLRPFKPPDDETRRLSEADQLRAELKGETGYGSYVEYLKNVHEELHWSLRNALVGMPPLMPADKMSFSILDLSQGANSGANVNLRCQTASAAQILANLRHPPAESSVQVLLWPIDGLGVDVDLVSALGLGLQIDPSFFMAVCTISERLKQQRDKGLPQHPRQLSRDTRPFAPPYLEIDATIVTIVEHQRPRRPRSVPIVLIAGRDWMSERIEMEIGCELPFLDSAVDTNVHGIPDLPQRWQYEDEAGGYARFLRWCLGRGNEGTSCNTNLMSNLVSGALLPLLCRSTLRIHLQCLETRDTYLKLVTPLPLDRAYPEHRNGVISGLYQQRLVLRRLVEDWEDDSDDLMRYMDWQALTDWLPAYNKFSERCQRVCESAYRLDAEIRDYLQLQAGEMGLWESRKSIELSSLQIEENKRAKLGKFKTLYGNHEAEHRRSHGIGFRLCPA